MALKLVKKEIIHRIEYKTAEGEAIFNVRQLSQKDTEALIEKYTTHVWDAPNKRTTKQRFEKFDSLGFLRDRFVKMIESWEGIEDESGNPMPCTKANKEFVYDHFKYIKDYILESIENIETAEADEMEAELKNFNGGQTEKL